MEQHRRFTIVMTRDGLIEKAHPIEDADIGVEVDYEPLFQNQWRLNLKEKFFTMRVAALACIFLIALLPFYMVINSSETYAYVDIDINPSMELEIDNDLEVTDIIPFNDDAELILDQIGELVGKNIEEAIEIIINTSEEKGLTNTAKNVLIGVHYLKDEGKDPIIKTIEDHFENKTTDWEVVTVVIPDEVRDAAEKNNKSMNETLANTVTEQSNQVEATITEKDKEVLQSFFNKDKTEVEITTDDSREKSMPTIKTEKKDVEKGKPFKDEIHPSELNSKNGDLNTNENKNGQQNGKAKGHHKDKHQEKSNNGNNNNKGKSNNGNGNSKDIDKAKHKENHHKDKQKGNGKGNNGNGNNGTNKNGKGHENRGNNGNGNNKDDGYSYSFPLYK